MSTKTLTALRTSSETSGRPPLNDITNHHDNYTLPRSKSSESFATTTTTKLATTTTSSKLTLKTTSSMEAITLAGLSSLPLQCIHLRASPSPSTAKLTSQFDDDSDDSDRDNGADDTSSSDDGDDDTTSPPYTRPCSPHPSALSDDEEQEYDLSKIKYTGGTDLAPCFRRANDEWESHIPGTPEIERHPISWDALAAGGESLSSAFDDDDDEDGDGDEVWPDEMDSDDFPRLHDWQHSWIWHPSASHSSTPTNVPSIHFHYVDTQIQACVTPPVQDAKFGMGLCVPGVRAVNLNVKVRAVEKWEGETRGRGRRRGCAGLASFSISEEEEEQEEDDEDEGLDDFVFCRRGRGRSAMRIRSRAPSPF